MQEVKMLKKLGAEILCADKHYGFWNELSPCEQKDLRENHNKNIGLISSLDKLAMVAYPYVSTEYGLCIDSDNTKSYLIINPGEEVVIPSYNFIAGVKEYKRKPVTLKENQILIVEGLHAVNARLNAAIPRKNKLKIYISPFTPIGLDRHNHISTTDVRFLRRMIRDYQHRGYTAEMTLNSWMGMRKSEANYVYPYQREADMIINTSLAYEIGVLRTYAVPLLYSVPKDSEYYEEAIRILKFLKGFINIPSEHVPHLSVLREFIGGGYYGQ